MSGGSSGGACGARRGESEGSNSFSSSSSSWELSSGGGGEGAGRRVDGADLRREGGGAEVGFGLGFGRGGLKAGGLRLVVGLRDGGMIESIPRPGCRCVVELGEVDLGMRNACLVYYANLRARSRMCHEST